MSDLSPQALLEAHRALARASTPEDERRAIGAVLYGNPKLEDMINMVIGADFGVANSYRYTVQDAQKRDLLSIGVMSAEEAISLMRKP